MSLEDEMMFIYQEVEEKGLRDKFDNQLAKMRTQEKHAHKTANERWEYALNKVKK